MQNQQPILLLAARYVICTLLAACNLYIGSIQPQIGHDLGVQKITITLDLLNYSEDLGKINYSEL